MACLNRCLQGCDGQLHQATTWKKVQELLAQGADPNATLGENGDTPLHVYVRDGRYECLLSLLVHSNPDSLSIDFPAGDLNTPLHVAAQVNNIHAVDALLSFGADLDCLNIFDQTPLDMAIANNHDDMNIHLRSLDGQTGAYVRQRVDKFVELPQAPTSLIGSKDDSDEGKELDGLPSLRERVYSSIGESERASKSYEEWLKWKKKYSKMRKTMSRLIPSGETPPVFHLKDGHRVLCLDGGGIRGLIQVEVLVHLEEATGRKIPELFDWIVGTSTGGIVALALVYGNKSLASIRKLYFELKEEVFARARCGFGCDTDALEKLLKREFGTTERMLPLRNGPNVLITAVDKSTNKLKLCWFNNCFHDDQKYYGELLWLVARYTSAAPCYFSPKDNYVDGGVLANNPSLSGLTEIQNYLRKNRLPAKVALVVSIGCGNMNPVALGDTDVEKYLFFGKHWLHPLKAIKDAQNLVTLLSEAITNVELVADNAHCSCREQGIVYYRFNPRLDDSIPLSETDNRILCKMIVKTKMHLCSYETEMHELILSFYYKHQFDSKGPTFFGHN